MTLYARLKPGRLGPGGVPWPTAVCGMLDCGAKLGELAELIESADENVRRLADDNGRVLFMEPGLVPAADGVWQLSSHGADRMRHRQRPKTRRRPWATVPGEVVRLDTGRTGISSRVCARPPAELRCPRCGSRQTITAASLR